MTVIQIAFIKSFAFGIILKLSLLSEEALRMEIVIITEYYIIFFYGF